MEPIPPCDLEPLYTTLDEIRAEHSRLLDLDTEDEAPGPGFWFAVQGFATRVAESGIYFDEPHEVKACQGYLSYWQRELSRAKSEQRFESDLAIPGLKPYDEAALRALQSLYANPFAHFAEEVQAMPQADARTLSSEELGKLIERKAAEAGLRFELDLVKEISGQVAGDTYAPTLVEFCLYHLFEDARTRIGNKLRRPPRERSFSCLQYLIDKTDRIYRTQGPSEQRAMLDALSEYGAGYDPGVPSDAICLKPKIEAVKGATSPTFKDVAGRALALTPFLLSSRVLFERASGLSIVHPALFRRWPELLAEIRVRKDRAERSRRTRFYGTVAVALVLLGLSSWSLVQVRGEKDQKRANALAAHVYRDLWAYEGCRTGKKPARAGADCSQLLDNARSKALEGVTTSPTSRAIAALNDTIGAMLGANARTWREGKLGVTPLAWRGSAPSVGPCPPERGRTGTLCFVDAQARNMVLPGGLTQSNVELAMDVGETHLALAWPTFDPSTWKVAEQVGLEAFVVERQSEVRAIDGLPGNRCQQRSVSHVRLSTDGQMASLDCVGGSREEAEALWDVVPLSDGAWQWIAPEKLESMRANGAILSVYFASPGGKGYATLKDDGEVEVFDGSAEEPVAAYDSDFLRSTGRPENLGFHPTEGFAAIGSTLTFDYPLVLVHDDEGRDRVFFAPSGLGTPQRVDFSPNGKCVEVRTVDASKNTFAYHIVLDVDILMKVAQQMGGPNPRYEARFLCGFEESK